MKRARSPHTFPAESAPPSETGNRARGADRAGGVLLLDLSMEREQATIHRFFGQSYLSSSTLGYILVGLLLLGVFGLRHYLRSLIALPEDERQIIADGCLINYYRNH